MFVDLIAEKCEVALLNDSTWEIEAEAENTERVVLPALPEPVSKLNAKDMQHIIPSVMRNLRGGGYIKWEREDNKPVWWPEDVVFANVKQRPEQQNSGWYISKASLSSCLAAAPLIERLPCRIFFYPPQRGI